MKKTVLITLIASMLFVAQSFANVSVELEDNVIQANVNAVVNVAEYCEFTGWERVEKEVSFYATCHGINKSIMVKDDGLLNSFVVKKAYQEVPIALDVYKSSGINWEKLNQALSESNSIKE